MIDKFLKATGLKNEKEFLKRYPTEDSFFNEYPEMLQYQKGGSVKNPKVRNPSRFLKNTPGLNEAANDFLLNANNLNSSEQPKGNLQHPSDYLSEDDLIALAHQKRGMGNSDGFFVKKAGSIRNDLGYLTNNQQQQLEDYMNSRNDSQQFWEGLPNFGRMFGDGYSSADIPQNSKLRKQQYGGYQSQTRRQGNIQITEDTPMDTFVPTNNNRNNGIFPMDPVNQMAPLMNPYATAGFNQNQLPTNYQPYDSVSYDGLLSDNYKRKEFNSATGSWDDMGRATKVELQPQYHGDWNNMERMNFERSQPEQIGGYKTTRGKRSRKFGNRTINYDPYQYGGQYQQGGEYDLTPEEIDTLKKLGYDFENL